MSSLFQENVTYYNAKSTNNLLIFVANKDKWFYLTKVFKTVERTDH